MSEGLGIERRAIYRLVLYGEINEIRHLSRWARDLDDIHNKWARTAARMSDIAIGGALGAILFGYEGAKSTIADQQMAARVKAQYDLSKRAFNDYKEFIEKGHDDLLQTVSETWQQIAAAQKASYGPETTKLIAAQASRLSAIYGDTTGRIATSIGSLARAFRVNQRDMGGFIDMMAATAARSGQGFNLFSAGAERTATAWRQAHLSMRDYFNTMMQISKDVPGGGYRGQYYVQHLLESFQNPSTGVLRQIGGYNQQDEERRYHEMVNLQRYGLAGSVRNVFNTARSWGGERGQQLLRSMFGAGQGMQIARVLAENVPDRLKGTRGFTLRSFDEYKQTDAAQLRETQLAISDLRDTFGKGLLPILRAVNPPLREFVNVLNRLAGEHPTLAGNLVKAGIGGFAVRVGISQIQHYYHIVRQILGVEKAITAEEKVQSAITKGMAEAQAAQSLMGLAGRGGLPGGASGPEQELLRMIPTAEGGFNIFRGAGAASAAGAAAGEGVAAESAAGLAGMATSAVAFGAALLPIVVVGGLLAALSLGLIAAYNHWDGFRKIVDQVVGVLKNVGGILASVAGAVGNFLGNTVGKAWNWIWTPDDASKHGHMYGDRFAKAAQKALNMHPLTAHERIQSQRRGRNENRSGTFTPPPGTHISPTRFREGVGQSNANPTYNVNAPWTAGHTGAPAGIRTWFVNPKLTNVPDQGSTGNVGSAAGYQNRDIATEAERYPSEEGMANASPAQRAAYDRSRVAFYHKNLGGSGPYLDTDIMWRGPTWKGDQFGGKGVGIHGGAVHLPGSKGRWKFIGFLSSDGNIYKTFNEALAAYTPNPTAGGGIAEVWETPQGHRILFWHMAAFGTPMEKRMVPVAGTRGFRSQTVPVDPRTEGIHEIKNYNPATLVAGRTYKSGSTVGLLGREGTSSLHLCVVTSKEGRVDIMQLTPDGEAQMRKAGYHVKRADSTGLDLKGTKPLVGGYSGVRWGRTPGQEGKQPYANYFLGDASATDMNPNILLAVGWAESRGNPYKTTDIHGVDHYMMEMSSDAFKAVGMKWSGKAEDQILGASRYLSYLYNGPAHHNLRRALAMYNGGPNRTDEQLRAVGSYAYADRVLKQAGYTAKGPAPEGVGHQGPGIISKDPTKYWRERLTTDQQTFRSDFGQLPWRQLAGHPRLEHLYIHERDRILGAQHGLALANNENWWNSLRPEEQRDPTNIALHEARTAAINTSFRKGRQSVRRQFKALPFDNAAWWHGQRAQNLQYMWGTVGDPSHLKGKERHDWLQGMYALHKEIRLQRDDQARAFALNHPEIKGIHQWLTTRLAADLKAQHNADKNTRKQLHHALLRSGAVHIIGHCEAEHHANQHRTKTAAHTGRTAHNTSILATHAPQQTSLLKSINSNMMTIARAVPALAKLAPHNTMPGGGDNSVSRMRGVGITTSRGTGTG